MILIIDSFSIVVLIIATIAVFVGGALGFFSWVKLRRKTYFLDYCNRKLGGKNE
jgi:hypothetical protein